MIYKILIPILILLFSTACNDGLGLPEGSGIQSDGTVEMTLSIPAADVVYTRGDTDPEYAVTGIDILIFNGSADDAELVQTVKVTDPESLGSDRYQVTFKLDAEIRSCRDLQFYFIANTPEDISIPAKGSSLSDFISMTATSVGNPGNLTMSGHTSVSSLTAADIPLYRNGAKVTVTDAVPVAGTDISEGNYMSETSRYPFSIVGTATESPLLAGTMSYAGSLSYGKPVTPISYSSDVDNNEVCYVHPTCNTGEAAGKSFIIVKTDYLEKSYFYRLDFKKSKNTEESDVENIDGEATYLDILPNHWYQVMISSVDGPGYGSPEEAAAHPVSLIRYEIHDHTPEIFNMVSDGMRELGVTHEVKYTSDENTDGTWSEEYVYIRCYSADPDELSALPDDLKITVGEEWLEISEAEEINDDGEIGIGSSADQESKGKLFRYRLRFNNTEELGSLNTCITVVWKGLEREIPVTWERTFSGSDLCSVKLMMYDESESLVKGIDDYWGFIGSKDEGATYPGDGLWGISPAANNGKIRNQGLHFPIMYGIPGKTDEKRWKYEYEVDMSALKEYSFNWSVEITGDPAITEHVTVNGEKSSLSGTHSANDDLIFKISRPGNAYKNAGEINGAANDYTYGTGKFILHVNLIQKSDEPASRISNEYSFDLYHTGFFHKDSQTYRADPEDVSDYYYYEVVPIMGTVRMRYWLDRNMGAKSSGMYIEATGGTTYHGDPKAAGGYYKVAEYRKNAYSDPKMITEVAPPGYRVPKQKVWDAMRNSNSFHTDVNGNYFDSYYLTDNPAVGKVYFPKAMMMSNGAKLGESRAGYYWTQTAATGTEKEEIGRWLKMLVISGSSTSYINGNVVDYYASVRCINDIPDESVIMRTSFNVKGATHVYLYKTDANGTKIPTTTWPGHVIGNYATMENGWFNFAFESTDFAPEELYVVFNFMDADGIIHTISQETVGSNTDPTDIKPSEATGWKVTGDDSDNLIDNNFINVKGIPTQLGYWWNCNHSSPFVYCYSKKIIRIYFKNNSQWSQPYLYLWKDDSNAFSAWPGEKMTQDPVNANEWYYDVDISYKHVIFNDGVDQSKTMDLTINEDFTLYNWWTDGNNDDTHWIKK